MMDFNPPFSDFNGSQRSFGRRSYADDNVKEIE
jgi:hypothetical protein